MRHGRFLIVIIGQKMCFGQTCPLETVYFITVQSEWEGVHLFSGFSAAARNQDLAPWGNQVHDGFYGLDPVRAFEDLNGVTFINQIESLHPFYR